ncbi:MAG: hypothetical protein EXQ84_02325 [Rhodospirillaceae bacterium]|nr:hypothetical protein [Rhodospirillaceae bacterium]
MRRSFAPYGCRLGGNMRSIVVSIAALLTLSGTEAIAQDSFADAFWQFRVSSGFDFSSGFYGAPRRTEILYVPLTLQAAKGPWTLKAVAPWLRVSGPALLIDGTGGGTAGVRTGGAASGLGDINFSLTYALEGLSTYGLYVDLTARAKAPTASFKKGLGTGAWDEALQIDIAKTVGSLMPFASVGYRFSGQPKGFALRDVVYGSVGLQYSWSDLITTGASYDVRRAAIKTAAAPQEGSAYVNIRFSDDWSLNVYGVAGFSPNSPSAGGGLVATYRWR